MCGVAGLIGQSKNLSVSYKICTNLFQELEIRGKDASGFWAVNYLYQTLTFKTTVNSSHLVERPEWEQLKYFDPELLLIHARAASIGGHFIKNSHPFVSQDQNLAIIHNGRLPEFKKLKKLYKRYSDCDSELILRMIEDQPSVLSGIQQILKLKKAEMAFAVGDIRDSKQHLWLYRNRHRPLHLIDVKELGQIFFCSTSKIWKDAVQDFDLEYEISEIPPGEIWIIENPPLNIIKIKIIEESLFYNIFNKCLNILWR